MALESESNGQRRVGLICNESISSRPIWNKLESAGIPQRCVVLNAKEAEEKFIASVHTKKNHIYFNEGSSEAASLAAGSVIEILSSDAVDENYKAPHIVSEDLHDSHVQVTFDGLYPNSAQSTRNSMVASPPPWRSELSKIDVWYAAFGSNMRIARLLCYIQGGQIEGMKRRCSGSMDKSPPKETLWKTIPHRLFFGGERTVTWGPGGAGFLHPESNIHEKAYICMYRITLEQLNDILLQENELTSGMSSPLFDSTALDCILNKQSFVVDTLKGGWYHNVVCLGAQGDVPILTITCTLPKIKAGKFPLCEPNKDYADTLVKGLVEGNRLSEEEARAYIHEAATKPL